MEQTRISMKEVRDKLGKSVDRVHTAEVPYLTLTARGRPLAALVPVNPDGSPNWCEETLPDCE